MVEIIILVPVKTFWFPEAKFLTKRILKPPSILDYYIVRTSLGPVSWLVYPSQTLIVWNNKNLFRRIMFNFLTYCILNNWFNWRPWACFKLLIFLHAGLCLYAGRWECPWHDCSVCGAPASSLCDFCPRSFCRDHEAGALIPSSLEGRLCCSSHNPGSPLGSSSGSTQPHCSALSPVRVKEEPEIESGLSATEWHRSAAQYLILWKVRSHWPPGFWSTSDPKQRTTKGNTVLFFFDQCSGPHIQRRDTLTNTSMPFMVRAAWPECWQGECLDCIGAIFPPLLPWHNDQQSPLQLTRAHSEVPDSHLIVFCFLFFFICLF